MGAHTDVSGNDNNHPISYFHSCPDTEVSDYGSVDYTVHLNCVCQSQYVFDQLLKSDDGWTMDGWHKVFLMGLQRFTKAIRRCPAYQVLYHGWDDDWWLRDGIDYKFKQMAREAVIGDIVQNDGFAQNIQTKEMVIFQRVMGLLVFATDVYKRIYNQEVKQMVRRITCRVASLDFNVDMDILSQVVTWQQETLSSGANMGIRMLPFAIKGFKEPNHRSRVQIKPNSNPKRENHNDPQL